MIFRMLWRSLAEGRKRKILAASTVALAATLITTLFALTVDVGDKMAQEMTAYGSNIRVKPKADAAPLLVGGIDYNPLKGHDYLDEADLPKIKDIFWRNNIVGLAPRLAMTVQVDMRGRNFSVPLIGTYFDHVVPLRDEEGYRTGVRSINPFWHVEGAWQQDGPKDPPPDHILVGRSLAAHLHLGVGATIAVRDADKPTASARNLRVSGILSSGGEEDNALLAPLALVQAIADLPGRVEAVDVSALTVPENDLSRKARGGADSLTSEEYDTWYCTAYVSAIAHQIEEALPNVSARPIWQVAAGEGAVIGRIQALLLVVSTAAAIAAAMCVSALMNTTVTERASEIGLMKALGASPGEVQLLFIGEAVVVGLLGGAVGLVAGAGLAQAVGWSVFGSGVEIRPITVPVVLAISVATVLIASIIPARAISALLPMEVLHGRR